MKTKLNMVKINLRQSQTVHIIMIIVLITGIFNYIMFLTINSKEEGASTTAFGNLLYLTPLLMAIFVPAENFSKMINLGGKRKDFFKSSIILYVLVSAIVTILSILFYFTIDQIAIIEERLLDVLDVFGFMENGVIIAFFQMWAFLILVSCTAHTITLIQGRWYGWVGDVLIIAIISVFTPIAPLRATLVWFFNMIIFHDIAIVQIISCLVLSAIIYCLSLIPIKSKAI